LALVAVSVVAVLQAQRATRSAAEAQAEAARANAAKDFLLSTYEGADPLQRDGRDATAKELLIAAEAQMGIKLERQPALKTEVLGTLQQAWVNLGDLSRSQTLNEQRAALLSSLGRIDEAMDAEMLSAEMALGQRDYALVDRKLNEFSNRKGFREASDDILGRYHYLRGALFSERGQPKRSVAEFDESIARARMTIESSGSGHHWLFMRLVGKVMASRLHGGRASAEKDLEEARSLIDAISKEDQRWVTPWTQLAVARYRIGDLLTGWPEIERAVSTAEADFGSRNPITTYDRTIWMLYCNAMGRPERAAEWLRRIKSSLDPSALQIYMEDPDWLLAAAGTYLAVDDRHAFDRVVYALRALHTRRTNGAQQGFRDSQSELALLVARAQLHEGRPAEALRTLAVDSAGAPNQAFTGVLKHEWLWIQGNAHRLQGAPNEAKRALRLAEATASAQLGAEHPEVALIRMDLAMALSDRSSGAADAELRALLSSAQTVLRLSVPDDHPRRRFLDSLRNPADAVSSLEGAALRGRLVAAKDRYFNDWF
jgi:tetratricopeptide (TPR) repeat protein